MLNRVILIGRLSKGIELRYTQTQKAVANSTLAVKRSFKGSNGEYETDFIDIVVWGAQGENLNKYCSKGDLIGVDGSIQVRKWQNQKVENRYSTEVVCQSVTFLETKKDKKQDNIIQEFKEFNKQPIATPENVGDALTFTDDDLPF